MSITKRLLARFGLDSNSKTIVNVADPVNAQDAATKNFASNASNLTTGTMPAARFPYTPVNQAGDYVNGPLGMAKVGPFGPQTLPNVVNDQWNPLAVPVSDGLCLFLDEEFAAGSNSVAVYNNIAGSTAVKHTRVSDPNAPNASKYVIRIDYDPAGGGVDPSLGGFVQLYNHAVNKIIVQRFRAKVPVGYTVTNNENQDGVDCQTYWLTSQAGTGKYEDYVRVTHCGSNGSFSNGGHVSLMGPAGTVVSWTLASCTAFEVTNRSIKNTGDETQTTILNKLGITAISGTNTGDETTASIRSKLGITTLSGSNTGDETNATILSKLGIPSIAGTNSGDETAATIKSKLGITTLSGSNTGDETQSSILTKLSQHTFRVISVGSSATTAPAAAAGLYIDGVSRAGNARSYGIAIIRRSDCAIVASALYDVYDTTNGPSNAATMASVLNSYGSDYIAVVWTYDEPTANRLSGGLAAAMYRCGASRAVFGSPAFQYRSAYVLVGICGCGEGNGLEAYRGDVSADTNAWCDVGFSVVNGSLTGVSGATRQKSTSFSVPDTVTALTATTATTTLDLSAAAVFEVTLSANTTFAFDFSKVPALSNQLFAFVLTIFNDGTAGRGVSFPSGTKWAGGQIPARTTAANARDDWYFYSRDGVNWIGSLSNQDVR